MINVTELITDPLGFMYSPFTDLFGSSFWGLVIIVICICLYIKNREVFTSLLFAFAASAVLTGTHIFAGIGEVPLLVLLMLGFSFGFLMVDVWYNWK